MAKACGDCGLCCKLMGIKSIAKVPHSWCGHYQRGQGCTVYADRPGECGAFACYWLRIDRLGDEWRPDRARFIMHLTEGGDCLEVEVDPAAPFAWKKAPYHAQLMAWAADGARRGLTLRVWIGERCIALTPQGEVDLGRRRSLALIAQDLAAPPA